MRRNEQTGNVVFRAPAVPSVVSCAAGYLYTGYGKTAIYIITLLKTGRVFFILSVFVSSLPFAFRFSSWVWIPKEADAVTAAVPQAEGLHAPHLSNGFAMRAFSLTALAVGFPLDAEGMRKVFMRAHRKATDAHGCRPVVRVGCRSNPNLIQIPRQGSEKHARGRCEGHRGDSQWSPS